MGSRPGLNSGMKTGMSTAPGMLPRVSCPSASSIITTLTELHGLFDIGTLQFIETVSVFILTFSLIDQAILVQAWTGAEGFRKLRLPDLDTIGT